MQPTTSVSFQTANGAIQRLYDTAEAKCLTNLQMFGPHQVLVEGGGYEKIWLETQPMGCAPSVRMAASPVPFRASPMAASKPSSINFRGSASRILP